MQAGRWIALGALLVVGSTRVEAQAALPLKHAPARTQTSISPADLMTRLYLYADDSMMGRAAGTQYNLKATAYIESEVRRLKLVPAGDSGGYFQNVPLVTRGLDAGSSVTIDGTSLKPWDEFVPRDPGRATRPFDGAQTVYAGVWPDTHLYVMNADGSEQTRLTSLPGFSGVPVYSPDGKRIAFQRTETLKDFHWQISVMDADGANIRQITHDASNNQVPNWSRDGQRLIFYSNRTGKNQIYSMKPDGSERRMLTDFQPGLLFVYDTQPCFSHDGKKLVFTRYRLGENESSELCVLDLDRIG